MAFSITFIMQGLTLISTPSWRNNSLKLNIEKREKEGNYLISNCSKSNMRFIIAISIKILLATWEKNFSGNVFLVLLIIM